MLEKSFNEFRQLCDRIINKYPFTQEEDIDYVRMINDDDLYIKLKNGKYMVFNVYMYEYFIQHNPLLDERSIEVIHKFNKYDLLCIKRDGTKFIYDTFDNTRRGLINRELTDTQVRTRFRYNLMDLMNRKFVTQEELANRVGTSQTMISHYISGRCLPNIVMLKKMAIALNCSLDDFYDVYYDA